MSSKPKSGRYIEESVSPVIAKTTVAVASKKPKQIRKTPARVAIFGRIFEDAMSMS
jgi:hypothetical protein